MRQGISTLPPPQIFYKNYCENGKITNPTWCHFSRNREGIHQNVWYLEKCPQTCRCTGEKKEIIPLWSVPILYYWGECISLSINLEYIDFEKPCLFLRSVLIMSISKTISASMALSTEKVKLELRDTSVRFSWDRSLGSWGWGKQILMYTWAEVSGTPQKWNTLTIIKKNSSLGSNWKLVNFPCGRAWGCSTERFKEGFYWCKALHHLKTAHPPQAPFLLKTLKHQVSSLCNYEKSPV